jgi:hypothetical protein
VICDRCEKEASICIGSEFNAEIICLDCKEEEEEHPLYEVACEAQAEAALRGELYHGIKFPPPLKSW